MAYDIGPRIGIDGEKEFKTALAAINSEMKNLKSEMDASVKSMSGMASEEELAAKKADILARSIEAGKKKIEVIQGQYDRAKEKLDQLGKALDDAKRDFGENSEEALKAQDAYNKQAKAVNDLGTQLNKAKADVNRMTKEMDEAGDEAKETGEELEDAGEKGKVFGDTMKGVVRGGIIVKGLEKIAEAAKKVVDGLKQAVIDGANYADDLVTLAAKTGIATDKLQEYQYMAGLVDVDVETITGSMKKLTATMYSASQGGAAASIFDELGVNIRDAGGALRDNEAVFGDVLDALGAMTDETTRDAYAMKLFGKGAQDLNPLIKAGGDTIEELADEAHRMGYVLDQDSLESLVAVSDALERINKATESIKNQLAVALAPVVEKIADVLTQAVNSVDWEEVGKKIGDVMTFIIDHHQAVAVGLGAIAAGFAAVSAAASPLVLLAIVLASIAIETAKVKQDLDDMLAVDVPGWAAGVAAAIGGGPVALMHILDDALKNNEKTADGWRNTHFQTAQDVAQVSIETSAAMGDAFLTAGETVKDAFEGINGVGKDMADNLKAAAKQIGDDFSAMKDRLADSVDGIKTKFGELSANVKAKAGEIKQWFADLPAQVYQIGANIVTGLWNGIKDKFSWLVGQIKSFAHNVVDQLKGFFGIHSPSTVMRDEVGENLALGIASGITAGIPAIKGAIGLVNDATLANAIMAPAARVTAPDIERVGSGIVNGLNAGTGGGISIEVPLVINGREFARAVLSDLRAVGKSSPEVVYG